MFFGDTMLDVVNKIMWAIATFLIVISSVYFSFSFRFIQFRFDEMIRNLFSHSSDDRGIKPMQSFFMTLGARIGVGSIAGVSLALYLGGPGSIFWLWVSAFLSAINAFSETVLGIIYRKQDNNGYVGGPSYYIKYGLGKYRLGVIYAVLIIISYVLGFVGIQGNTITKACLELINVSPFIIGLILTMLASFIIFGGLKKIAGFSEKLVPFMTVLYLGISVFVLFNNINALPNIFRIIVSSAFSHKSIYGGLIGTIIIGIQRGIFSNEAGLGTGSITSSSASTSSPTSQGYIQMFGVYVTTLLICTATAIIVMTSDYQYLNISDINGIEITQYAFKYHLGNMGNILLSVCIFLFSFTTILTGYYDGESSLKFLIKNTTRKHLVILKLFSLLVLFLGSILSSYFLWSLVDIMVALLAIINIYTLFSLRREVKLELECYNTKKYGKINKR